MWGSANTGPCLPRLTALALLQQQTLFGLFDQVIYYCFQSFFIVFIAAMFPVDLQLAMSAGPSL